MEDLPDGFSAGVDHNVIVIGNVLPLLLSPHQQKIFHECPPSTSFCLSLYGMPPHD